MHEPAAKVRHRVPASRTRWSYFSSRCFAEGLGKAMMSEFVGSQDGLSTERTYTFRTLPAGVLRGLADAVFRFDPAGLNRAGAIVAGLALAAAGYLRYKLQKGLFNGGVTADKLDATALGPATGPSPLVTHNDGQDEDL